MEAFTRKRGNRRASKSILFMGILVLLTMLLAACGGTTTTTGTTPTAKQSPTVAPPTDLITSGTLTVGSDTTYPPQESINPTTGQAVGSDIDIITAIAQRMGLQAKIVTDKFDVIFDDLAARRFDVVISALFITPDRQKKVDFVPYFKAGESLLVQAGNPMNIASLANLCGRNAGVQTGTAEQDELKTASADCVKAGKPAINVTSLQDQTAVIELLANHRVDATYQDTPVTDYYNKLNPGRFSVGGVVVNYITEGILVRKGDTSMFNAIQTAFHQLKADGTYHSIILKWGLITGEISLVDRRTSTA